MIFGICFWLRGRVLILCWGMSKAQYPYVEYRGFVFFQTVFLNLDVRLHGGLLACPRLGQKIALHGLMELPGVTFDGEENGKKVVSMMNSNFSFY